MRSSLLAAILFVALARPAFAHRLDEYLQATTFSLQKDRIAIQVRLTPGVAVVAAVLRNIDTNGDGIISDAEAKAYADKVRSDLSLAVDGDRSPLSLVSLAFPPVDEMKQGLGEIILNFAARLPSGVHNRQLLFENHHESKISVYLVNCLVPRDADIRVTSQDRSYDQSRYQLNYTQATVSANAVQRDSDRSGNASLFKAYVYQGIHHILTGYDHLLFVSALVLAATTLWEVVKVVFTFTLAHSITLTLAALNVIHLPESVVEPLISASIVFVALQNVFWPTRSKGWSRLGIAFFFGLFHGLGFAGGLLEAMREMPGATMLLAILAFSCGVEIGHQMVVLPLFAVLKLARRSQPDVVARTQLSMTFQRIGSAGISLAGIYYLWLALAIKA